MAVTRNNGSSGSGKSPPGTAPYTVTFNYTVNAQSNRLLTLFVETQGTINGVTYNGVAMTQTELQANGDFRTYCFTLVDPDSGSHAVVITFHGSLQNYVYGIADFYGVNTADPINATAKWGGTITHGTSHGTDITTDANECYIFDGIASNYSSGITLDPTETQRWNTSSTWVIGGGSDAGILASAGTKTMTWANTGSISGATVAHVVLAINRFGTDANSERSAKLTGVTTKLYLQNHPAYFAPASIRGAWDVTNQAQNIALSPIKKGSVTSLSISEAVSTNNWDMLFFRAVTPPLAANHTVRGSLNVIIGAREDNGSMNAYWHIHAFVTQGDSNNLRGTLLTDSIDTTGEFPTTAVGKALQANKTLTSVDALEGDRIVVEIGITAKNTGTTPYTGQLWRGGEGSDLTVGGDETTLTGLIEFLDQLTFDSDPTYDDRAATLTGKATANSERSAKIVGGVKSERAAKIHGKILTNSSRSALIHGKAVANSERSARLTGERADTFTKEIKASLPSTDANLVAKFTSEEVAKVGDNDSDYVLLDGLSAGYLIQQFKKYNTNEVQDPFTVTIDCRSSLAPTSSTIYLQIFNRTSGEWETLDSDNASDQNTDFTLTGSKSSGLEDYYDSNFVLSFRVYQQIT